MRTRLHRLAHRRSNPRIGRKTIALATLALAACVSTALAQTLLFKDDFSDSKLSGWVQLGVPGALSNVNQQALISANCGPLQTNNPFATHFAWGHAIPMPPELTNNWTLEGRLDLVSANQNDAWASVHFLWSPLGNSGYAFLVDRDEAALLKFWNGTGSVAWFFHEPREIKNQNVTLVLSVTRRDANLVINTRVLDKDNANAVVFDRTVIDTPQADPTLPSRSVKGTPSMNDMGGEPWRMVSGPGQIEVTLDWTNPTSGPTGPAQVVYDNVEVWLYESPRPNVIAWGYNFYGQASVPPDLTNAIAVAAGGSHSVALRADGALVSWGKAGYGQDNPPAGLSNVVAVAAGGFVGFDDGADHSLALSTDGTVVLWGQAWNPPSISWVPISAVPDGLTNVVAVAAGKFHNLALRSDGTVAAWVVPQYLDRGANSQPRVPFDLTNVVAVAAGGFNSLALRADGTVVWWDWGGSTLDVPGGLSNAVGVAMGESHCLALRGDGTVVAWGTYLSGKPSSGWTNLAMNVPAGLTNVVAVAAGESDCLALRADGTILTWGGSFWCRDWSPEENTPIGLTKVQALGGGSCHCLALIGDGPPTLQAPINHPAMTAEGFSVSVPTQSGHVYCLEYKHSLADPDWTPLPLVAGTGHERTLTDPTTTGKQRFYRVRRW